MIEINRQQVKFLFLAALVFFFSLYSFSLFNPTTVVTAQGVNRYDSTLTLVPDSDTLLTASIVDVQSIHCENETGGAVTILITDNAATPLKYFPTVSMAASSVMVAHYGNRGIRMNGIRWTAGAATSIRCQITGGF